MQFIDLHEQQKRIREKIEKNIQNVLDHGKYIMGPEVYELEKRLAAFVDVQHGISCGSGTDALLLALMAMDVGPGDAVFTSPFTFVATAEVIALVGATPVFADIDPDTFNMAPSALENAIKALMDGNRDVYPLPASSMNQTNVMSLKPRGIIAVDLFGQPADYDEILSIANRYGLFVLEDAAQSFGGEYKGKKACGFGEIGCTSFFPAKPLGGYGDGGMCFTDDDTLADKLQSLRNHGTGVRKYENIRIGINGRLDTIQAAVLLAKFDLLPEEIKLRQEVVDKYNRLLEGTSLVTPQIPDNKVSAWAQYSILAESEKHRSELQNILKNEGIPTAIYYPKSLHQQPAFSSLGYRGGEFPVSEDFSHRIFSLPMHPYLPEEEQTRIAKLLRSS